MYRCEAETVEAFVQQVAVSYVLHGYFRYRLGRVLPGQDPQEVDAAAIDAYALDVSKWVRARARKRGRASLQYLRHGRTFVLFATDGELGSDGFEVGLSDIRTAPLCCFGYEISCYLGAGGKWRPSVRVARGAWRRTVRRFRRDALREDRFELEAQVRGLPFAPFAPVRWQVRSLVRAVNRRRKCAGLWLLSFRCVRSRRRPVRVFRAEKGGGGGR